MAGPRTAPRAKARTGGSGGVAPGLALRAVAKLAEPSEQREPPVQRACLASPASEQHKPPRPPRTGLDPGGLHSPEFVLEVLDLVSDPGGNLELQLRGGRVHLLGQLTDQRHQVTTGLAPARRGPAGSFVGG